MTDEVQQTLERLKSLLHAKSDADLARKLTIDKSTISSWKARGRVPERFQQILNGGSSHEAIATPPLIWGEHEKAAFTLALFRYARAASSMVMTGDYGANANLAPNASAVFWSLFRASQKDIISRQDEGRHTPDTAVALLIHDDLLLGDISIRRDRDLMEHRMLHTNGSPAARF